VNNPNKRPLQCRRRSRTLKKRCLPRRWGKTRPREGSQSKRKEEGETAGEELGGPRADGEGKEEEERKGEGEGVSEAAVQEGEEGIKEEETTEDGGEQNEGGSGAEEEKVATAEQQEEVVEGGNEAEKSTEERESEERENTVEGEDGDGEVRREDIETEVPAEETVINGVAKEKSIAEEQEVGMAKEVEGGVAKEKSIAEEQEVGLAKEVEEGVAPSEVDVADSNVVTTSRLPLENIVEEEEEEEEEEKVDKDELITNCREALKRQEKLRHENSLLQHKIAEYLSYKKQEEKPDPGRNVTDQEKRYIQCMSGLDNLEVELEQAREGWASREEEMRESCARRLAEVQGKTEEFLRYQMEGSKQAVDSRTGHRLSETDLHRLQTDQAASNQAVFQARLENIKLANKIERMESLLKAKEELAEGLHMLDFEQLKISNMDLGEKVEERNEEIRKLTEKIRDTVQVLTHVKEKLDFLQDESEEKKEQLQQLDSDLARRREVLTRLKQTRDSLRLDNQRLRQRGGLVCHTQLLRDFEDRQDQNAELESRLEQLQRQHSQTTLQCTGLRSKIAHATTPHQHRLT
ncbi:Coiled-coil domain-containing protein 96, partial [Geodia barretti]